MIMNTSLHWPTLTDPVFHHLASTSGRPPFSYSFDRDTNATLPVSSETEIESSDNEVPILVGRDGRGWFVQSVQRAHSTLVLVQQSPILQSTMPEIWLAQFLFSLWFTCLNFWHLWSNLIFITLCKQIQPEVNNSEWTCFFYNPEFVGFGVKHCQRHNGPRNWLCDLD